MHLFCFVSLFLLQLCWPCISCISCTGVKTLPHLYTMPSPASVISLPSWEQPLLTHGWENSSKDDGRSQSKKLRILIVQRLSLLAFCFQARTCLCHPWQIRISLRLTIQKGFVSSLSVFPIFLYPFLSAGFFSFT